MKINITRQMLVDRKACIHALKIFDERHPDGKWVEEWTYERAYKLFSEFPGYYTWLLAYNLIPRG